MKPTIVTGDLLDQRCDAIVNAWNRNVIPWFLLLPQGVSGAIKRKGGHAPFRALATMGPIPLGEAVWTGAGKLPYRGIIHVAGINLLWTASKESITRSVHSAMRVAREHEVRSIAFPVIGAGSGGFDTEGALAIMLEAFESEPDGIGATIVRFGDSARGKPG